MTDIATSLDVPTLLENALAILRERGLAKGVLEDENGRVCARGAIMLALGAWSVHYDGWTRWRALLDRVEPAERLLSQAAADTAPARWGGGGPVDPEYVVSFNNAPQTTQPEMEAVFEAAISAARGA